MLRKIEFENIMSLKNVSVDLEPLTIFIGPNGSGKSAIFKALVAVSKLLRGFPIRGPKGEFVLEEGVTFDDLVWSGNSGLPIRFRAWFEGDTDEPGYTLELRKKGEGWGVARERLRAGDKWIEVDEEHPFTHPTERLGTRECRPPMRGTLRHFVHPFINDSAARPVIEPILQFSERFGQSWRYRPSASDIASFVAPPKAPPKERGRGVYVRENGWGLAREFQALWGKKPQIYEAIQGAVCRVFPHIKAVRFETDWQGVRLSFITDRSEDPVPAPQESDGVLLATFLFWRLYTGEPFLKVCLEEPENGLHPFLLAERFRLLKMFTEPGEGRPALQLLVATHSPEFLRAVKAHPTALFKQIRLVEFAPSAGTRVSGLPHYRDATRLIEEYLTQVDERWRPVVLGWSEERV